MAMGLLGIKVGMTQVFDDDGKAAPVTVLQVGPCPLLLIRDKARDGYDALQLGFLEKPRRTATRAEARSRRCRPGIEADARRAGRLA